MGLKKYLTKLREYFNSPKVSAFIEGMGSLSIWGPYSSPPWMNNNLTPSQQDYLAIKGDWEKVGSDLEKAINDFKKK